MDGDLDFSNEADGYDSYDRHANDVPKPRINSPQIASLDKVVPNVTVITTSASSIGKPSSSGDDDTYEEAALGDEALNKNSKSHVKNIISPSKDASLNHRLIPDQTILHSITIAPRLEEEANDTDLNQQRATTTLYIGQANNLHSLSSARTVHTVTLDKNIAANSTTATLYDTYCTTCTTLEQEITIGTGC
jgi:hypothetical protein